MRTFIENFREYFGTCSKVNSEQTDYIEAIKILVDRPEIDVVWFHTTKHLVPNEIGWINKNKMGQYYVDINLVKHGDIFTNFCLESENKNAVNFKLILLDREVDLNNSTLLVPASASYTVFCVRFTFDEKPFELKFSYDEYVCQQPLRRTLRSANFTESGIRYHDEFACCAEHDPDEEHNKKIHSYLSE